MQQTPLHGLKVIEIGVAMAGPFCGMMFGDYGAELIKVERIGQGDESRGWGPFFPGKVAHYFASVNRSKKSERVFFRRELVSFEISGPQGLVECQPGPDNRAPDRGAIATLRPGGRISATSRLIELCPEGSLRIPGLYLVHARFDSVDSRDPNAPTAFSGRLVSQKPVAIRVRRGWGEMPAQREPERVQIGTP